MGFGGRRFWSCILGSVKGLFLGMLVAVATTGPIALALLPYPSLYWPFTVVGFAIAGLAFLSDPYRANLSTVWPHWSLMDFAPEGRPDRGTRPQKFRSEFLE